LEELVSDSSITQGTFLHRRYGLCPQLLLWHAFPFGIFAIVSIVYVAVLRRCDAVVP
jgi:hypothetical protein